MLLFPLCFAIVKDVVHSLEREETPSWSQETTREMSSIYSLLFSSFHIKNVYFDASNLSSFHVCRISESGLFRKVKVWIKQETPHRIVEGVYIFLFHLFYLEPEVCFNERTLRGGTYGYFICPEPGQPDSYQYCCGMGTEEKCCTEKEHQKQK